MDQLKLIHYGVKIYAGKAAGGNPIIYYNSGFLFEQFMKWKWYFDYKAALYKVQHPKHHVEVFYFNYDYVPPMEQQIKILRNKIIAKKGSITAMRNKYQVNNDHLNKVIETRNVMFIETDPDVISAKQILSSFNDKIIKKENELAELQTALYKLTS